MDYKLCNYFLHIAFLGQNVLHITCGSTDCSCSAKSLNHKKKLWKDAMQAYCKLNPKINWIYFKIMQNNASHYSARELTVYGFSVIFGTW